MSDPGEDDDPLRRNRSPLHSLASRAESALWQVHTTIGPGRNRLTVVPYLAHGNRDLAIVRGRVLAHEVGDPVVGVERLGSRVERMVRRFATNEVPGVRVLVRVGDGVTEGVTNADGYFMVHLDGHGLPADRVLHPVEVTALGVGPRVRVRVQPAHVMVPTIRARRLVISDVDDTVLHSEATDTPRLVLNTITGSSWTRRGFPGTSTLYEGLQRGAGLDEDNPFAYVSSSPWNLYDFLTGFLRRAALPTGPLFLRDMAIERSARGGRAHGAHKGAAIAELLRVHDLPVVLVGDTGQHDPEIYLRVARDHPGRVEAVLLRHVAGDARLRAVKALYTDTGLTVGVSASTVDLAAIAEQAGLIGPGWTDRVDADA